ncbi:SDR family NAD(P)-dependent oxidoreductase [Nonomuraea sp. CA-218870]|uniref:SDR family NAD(P)-dependent oxidoreductase n=1 Tax=Nonomuraea sp. CA-218870 TaxID=3239998 RepID=UPI003D8F33E7
MPQNAMPQNAMPRNIDLTGQTAVVTGCSSGLGRRFAVTLAEHGAKVVAVARRAERLEELAGQIEADGGSCLPLGADLTDDARLEGLLDAAEERFGTATILVNNAGVPDAQYATKMPIELVDRVLGTNLRAPWLLSCDFARRLIKAGTGGRVVNISSMGAFEYRGGGAALYSVTKAAVVRMTEVLAVEWAKFHINVNAIAPGAFASEMMDGMVRRTGDPTGYFPRARMGDPRQLDSTLLYLVSPHSEFVTGTVIKVDDGQGGR